MTTTNYQKGANFERRVIHDLGSRGYYCVRAAGSHTKIDVAAFKGSIALMVQCKLHGAISKADRDQLCAVATCPNFLPILAQNIKGKIHYSLADTREDFDPGESL